MYSTFFGFLPEAANPKSSYIFWTIVLRFLLFLPFCARGGLSWRIRSRWLGCPISFPPPATLLIGKFTSLQGTTDSSVN